MSEIKRALVGKTLTGYTLDPAGDFIVLHCVEGNVRLRAEGDCCSHTWIESIDDPGALRGLVLDAEEVDLPNAVPPGGTHVQDPECVAFYGLKITTEHGRAMLDYRNDSNGYYGGSLKVVPR